MKFLCCANLNELQATCFQYLHLFIWPLVQSYRLDLGYVSPKTTMDATALNADEDAKINVSPVWICTKRTRTKRGEREREEEGGSESKRVLRNYNYLLLKFLVLVVLLTQHLTTSLQE